MQSVGLFGESIALQSPSLVCTYPPNEIKGFAWILANLCLTFGVPTSVARANSGPADHSRGQGPIESAGGWHRPNSVRPDPTAGTSRSPLRAGSTYPTAG